ncbi:hypothetical protein TEA_008305 [Camellia sinensis var. sinensis]|uniref:Calcineurin-like phosphoesterase domain-containing protein n=1 Tax=Camellia sinensis var. sinensis TaxID=542762 RepID=A0A4S4ESC3_CAMSN|nr:hypothetical protein TEA_008305 [Camellia sinensis var. sinensis]
MSVTFLFFILAVGWTVALPTMPEKHLHVGPGGVFKIALFADLHFGEGEEVDWGPQQDVNSSKVMSTLLHIEIPAKTPVLLSLAFLCSTMAWCWTNLSVTYLSLLFRFIVAVGWTVDLRTTPEGYLQVLPGAAFKISLFADLHFGENAWNDWGPQQDVNSLKVMSTVLDLENPVPIGNRCFTETLSNPKNMASSSRGLLTLFPDLNESTREIAGAGASEPQPNTSGFAPLNFPMRSVEQKMAVQTDIEANQYTLKSCVETMTAVTNLSHRLQSRTNEVQQLNAQLALLQLMYKNARAEISVLKAENKELKRKATVMFRFGGPPYAVVEERESSF